MSKFIARDIVLGTDCRHQVLSLVADASTNPSSKSCSGFRAVEKTVQLADGTKKQCVTLFVRYGKSTLAECLTHWWNRRKEVALAEKVLGTMFGAQVAAATCNAWSLHRPSVSIEAIKAGFDHEELKKSERSALLDQLAARLMLLVSRPAGRKGAGLPVHKGKLGFSDADRTGLVKSLGRKNAGALHVAAGELVDDMINFLSCLADSAYRSLPAWQQDALIEKAERFCLRWQSNRLRYPYAHRVRITSNPHLAGVDSIVIHFLKCFPRVERPQACSLPAFQRSEAIMIPGRPDPQVHYPNSMVQSSPVETTSLSTPAEAGFLAPETQFPFD